MAAAGPAGHRGDHDVRRQVLHPDPNRADRPGRVPDAPAPARRIGFACSVRLAGRLELAGRVSSPAASASAAPAGSPGRQLAAGPSASPAPSAHHRRRPLRRGSGRRQQPSPVRVAGRPAVHRPAHRRASWPTLRFALEDKFGPIDEVRQEANIGPVISAELAQQALLLHRPRLDRHPGLGHVPLPGLPHGRDGHRRADPRRASSSSASSRSWARSSACRSTRCS